jgi:molybdopterin-containing oxidoreductase family membrane subunit
VAYGYLMEGFIAWYSGNYFERYMVVNRLMGPYAWTYWLLILSNVLVPQVLWWGYARSNVVILFAVALVINLGMWLERFVIVVTSLHRTELPAMWDMYYPTFWDVATFIGSIGLFFCLLFLFVRFLPMISIFEMRALLSEEQQQEERA